MTIIRSVLFLLLVLGCSSCIQTFYYPNAANVPAFHDKREAVISGSIIAIPTISGHEFQAAVAPVNHFALMANYMDASWYGGDGNDYGSNGSEKFYEFGLGYFRPIKENISFEIFGGMGKANAGNDYYSNYDYTDYKSGMNFNRYFIQPDIGYYGKYFEIIGSIRIGQVYFYNVYVNNSKDWANSMSSAALIWTGLDNLQGNHTMYLVEPAITIRGGWRYIKLQLQIAGNYTTFSSPPLLNMNLGLCLLLK